MSITWKRSPNFTKGRGSRKIKFIVIHWIVGKLSAADTVFAKPGVSSHYAVGARSIHQYVKETDTAWHAGDWIANQESIGIEHEGGPDLPITSTIYKKSSELIAEIWRRHGIIPLRKHSEFRATQCPGTVSLSKLDRMARDIINPPDPCKNIKAELATSQNQVVVLDDKVRVLTKERNELADKLSVKPSVITETITKVEYKDKPLTVGQALSFLVEVIKKKFRRK